MKTIKKTFTFGAALFAAVAAFGQYTVLVNETNTVMFPTNFWSANSNGVNSVLPANLTTLSTWNGGGLLTNLAYPAIYAFTNAGTTNWTIPTAAKLLLITAIGHGGAGGSGARAPAGAIASGGGGGSGGGYVRQTVDPSMLWTNVLVIILPAIPAGGGSVTTDNTFGTNGASANNTWVYVGSATGSNMVVTAGGGSPGVGGDADGSSGGSGSVISEFIAGAGAASSATGGAGAAPSSVTLGLGSSGGGSGGGITTGNVVSAGGAGGWGPRALQTTASVSGGSADGGIGDSYTATLPADIAKWLKPYPGAGGGGSGDNEAGGAGGNGYGWGSGGGGGGGSRDGQLSGKGGDGGSALVVIEVY